MLHVSHPKKLEGKESLEAMTKFLMRNNPLLKNVPGILISAFLKVCPIRQLNREVWIYRRSDPLLSFYIILEGEVKLINSAQDFKKKSVAGETLSEEILFMEFNINNTHSEGAKTLSLCQLLEVHYDVYFQLYKELVLKGFKFEFLTMERLIRRNFVLKQALRSKK